MHIGIVSEILLHHLVQRVYKFSLVLLMIYENRLIYSIKAKFKLRPRTIYISVKLQCRLHILDYYLVIIVHIMVFQKVPGLIALDLLAVTNEI